MILRRGTHIDQLAHKLREDGCGGVIEPILAGADEQSWSEEDLLYVRDLGLIAQDAGGPPRIANPIYAEVVPRHLNAAVQAGLAHERAWYVDSEGVLDVEGLLADFQTFFREHSEHWVQRFDQYQEAGPGDDARTGAADRASGSRSPVCFVGDPAGEGIRISRARRL